MPLLNRVIVVPLAFIPDNEVSRVIAAAQEREAHSISARGTRLLRRIAQNLAAPALPERGPELAPGFAMERQES